MLGRPIPLAWAPQALLGISAIEVYPAATLSAHGVRSTGYKKPQNRAERREIVAALRIRIALPADEGCLEMSPDALDAVVCLLAAKEFVEERSMPPVDRHLAEQEGWIWVSAKTRKG